VDDEIDEEEDDQEDEENEDDDAEEEVVANLLPICNFLIFIKFIYKLKIRIFYRSKFKKSAKIDN